MNKLSSNKVWDDTDCIVSEEYEEPVSKNTVINSKSHKNILLSNKGGIHKPFALTCRESRPRVQSMEISRIRDIQSLSKAREDTPRHTSDRYQNFSDLTSGPGKSKFGVPSKNVKSDLAGWKERCKFQMMMTSPKILLNMQSNDNEGN